MLGVYQGRLMFSFPCPHISFPLITFSSLFLFIHHCTHPYKKPCTHSSHLYRSCLPSMFLQCSRPISAFLCFQSKVGGQWQLETLQQAKWVCLAVSRPGEVVALSSACDIETDWSCQTKPVKCKTNLPIHLSESCRGRRRWYNCARCYMHCRHFLFLTVFGGQISQSIFFSTQIYF